MTSDNSEIRAEFEALRTDIRAFKEELARRLFIQGIVIVVCNVGLTVALERLLP